MKDAIVEFFKNYLNLRLTQPAAAALFVVAWSAFTAFASPCLLPCSQSMPVAQVRAHGAESDSMLSSCCAGGQEMSCCSRNQSKSDLLCAGAAKSDLALRDFALVLPTVASSTASSERLCCSALTSLKSTAVRQQAGRCKIYIVNRQLLI